MASDEIEQELEDIEAMFVQVAQGATVDGDVLTLHDVGASTLYFSDRPKRVVGHVTSTQFVDIWDEGDNSFKEDPPNAVLAFLEPGDDMPEDVVVVIATPGWRARRSRTGSSRSRASRPHTRRAA